MSASVIRRKRRVGKRRAPWHTSRVGKIDVYAVYASFTALRRAHAERTRQTILPTRGVSLFTTSLAGKLYEQLSKCADEGGESKAHDRGARWDHHGPEYRIGFQDLSLHSIYARPPPRMPDVVEEKNGRHGSVDCDHHLRVSVVQQASGTVLARGINPRQSCGCMLQQDSPL